MTAQRNKKLIKHYFSLELYDEPEILLLSNIKINIKKNEV